MFDTKEILVNASPTDRAEYARKRPKTVAELADHVIPQDRLWVVEDVAAFLRRSVRWTEDFVKDPTVPQPIPGMGSVWSGKSWQAWELSVASNGSWIAERTAGAAVDQSDDNDVLVLGAV